MNLYKIKPLKWDGNLSIFNEFISYTINKNERGFYKISWHVNDDNCGEIKKSVLTPKLAKQLAQIHLESLLTQYFLTKVRQK